MGLVLRVGHQFQVRTRRRKEKARPGALPLDPIKGRAFEIHYDLGWIGSLRLISIFFLAPQAFTPRGAMWRQ
jgi:hypothetical protein